MPGLGIRLSHLLVIGCFLLIRPVILAGCHSPLTSPTYNAVNLKLALIRIEYEILVNQRCQLALNCENVKSGDSNDTLRPDRLVDMISHGMD